MTQFFETPSEVPAEDAATGTPSVALVPAVQDLLQIQQALLHQAGQDADEALRRHVFEAYLKGVKPNTRERRHDDVARLRTYLNLVLAQVRPDISLVDASGQPLALDTEHALPLWGVLTAGLVTGFRTWLFKEGYALETINGTLSTVRVFAELAVKARILPPEELDRIRAVKGYRGEQARLEAQQRETTRRGHKKAEETLISEEQREALFSVPDRKTPQGWRDLVLLLLLYDLGIRPNELVSARLSDLDLTRGVLRVYRHKTGGDEQWLELSRDTWEAINRYLSYRQDRRPEAPLIITTRKNKQFLERVPRQGLDGTVVEVTPGISTRNLSERVHVLGERVGLDINGYDPRHQWASDNVDMENNVIQVLDAGGWARDSQMLLRYRGRKAVPNRGLKLKRRPLNFE